MRCELPALASSADCVCRSYTVVGGHIDSSRFYLSVPESCVAFVSVCFTLKPLACALHRHQQIMPPIVKVLHKKDGEPKQTLHFCHLVTCCAQGKRLHA